MAVITSSSAVSPTRAATIARTYFAFGHFIASQIELPVPECATAGEIGWRFVFAAADAVPAPQGELIKETTCNEPCHNGLAISRMYRGPAGAWIWSRDTGWYHVTPDARCVTVYAEPDADERAIGLVLMGHISIFVLYQLGLPSLHASAVLVDGGAVAFLGPPGTGKSTMAACFLRRGATLLSDDVLPLEQRQDGIYGLPGAPFMKVWPGTARETLGIEAELPALSSTLSKKLLRIEGRFPFETSAARLRAVYLLGRYDPERAGDARVHIDRLSHNEAFPLLINQSPRCDSLYPREAAQLLPLYARLMAQASVRLLRIPNGYEHHDVVRECILADLEAGA